VLYIEPAPGADGDGFSSALEHALVEVRAEYPGVTLKRAGDGWQVVVPAAYHVGHEAHFAQVAAQFLGYVEKGALPAWEVPDMIAKYRTTTQALEIARGGAKPDA
jgi:Putative oxidoreductase C terminal domain